MSLPDALSEADVEKIQRLVATVDKLPAPPPTMDVVLTGSGTDRIGLIKAIRDVSSWKTGLGLGLREAKDIVEGPIPAVVCANVTHEDAQKMQKVLGAAGGTITLRRSAS